MKRAVELGQPALAITDHGVLTESPVFYHAARKANIEPIIGCEFYFVDDASTKPTDRYHVGILARGFEGYKVIAELNTETHRQFHFKPLLDRRLIEQLGDAAQHLVCLSGCAGSIISRKIIEEDLVEAGRELAWWREMFPHFYIELMQHGTSFDAQLNAGLIKLAERYHVPVVATNDPHFVMKDDAHYHDTLLAIQTASDVDDPNRFRFEGKGYWLKSRKEMFNAFKPYGADVWKEAAANTLEIAELCYTRIPAWDERHWHIPSFKDADGDSYGMLKRLAYQGLREHGWAEDDTYRTRVKTELAAIKQVGIADFLLVTRDCIQWAVEQGIPVGPGRGSVCGTLVGYLIGIHKIDPVRYDLMFERFLNPARPRMPDIDTDFGPARRSEMFDYVSEKYGSENVVHVAAYGRMQVRKAFRSLARSYGVSFQDSNRLSKLLPEEVSADEDAMVWPAEFQTEIIDKYPSLHTTLIHLVGVKTGVGQHPAGVIIADEEDELHTLVPELWIPSAKKMCGQYDLEAVEEMGLMKQDFLGLRTLETIKEAVRIIEETRGEVLDPDSWVPDEEEGDSIVYEMLARGETAGVFQMEGPTNQRGIRDVGCTCFEDIVSTTSLYRTGAISAGFPKIFNANRKKSLSKVPYHHPSLKPILERTWGVVLYQEQVMEMAHQLAGFNMEEVDDIKESIKHKKSALLESMGPKFIQGCVEKSGMSPLEAKKTWQMIEGYSGYGYNRCVVGDTVVYRAGNSQYQESPEITVSELYWKWKLDPNRQGVGKKYRHSGLNILGLVDGRIKKMRCIDIHEQGVQPVWKVTLANGMSITTSAGHRHLTPEGWREVRQLHVGDTLCVNAGSDVNSQYSLGIGKGWRAGHTGGAGETTHGNTVALREVTELLPSCCEFCGAIEGRLERAHLDGDRSNNARDNVKRLCNRCHKNHDREARSMDSGGPRYRRGFAVGNSPVVAIEYMGEEQTYDLEMEDVGHNFVANGILTHNSHAVAYTFITYQTARLKALYPAEFATALLRTVDNKEKRDAYLRDAIRAGLEILPPSINVSEDRFTLDGEAIRFGFLDVAGIGAVLARRIVEGRPKKGYKSLDEVSEVIRNSRAVASLQSCGAFEEFGYKWNEAEAGELLAWQFHDPMEEVREEHGHKLVLPEDLDDPHDDVTLIGEVIKISVKQTKGGKKHKDSTTYQTVLIRWSPTEAWNIQMWSDSSSEWYKWPLGTVISVKGRWEPKWENISVTRGSQVRVLREAKKKAKVNA